MSQTFTALRQMSTQQNYGEPWVLKYHSWAESSLYSPSLKEYILTHSIDDEKTNEFNQEEREINQADCLNRIAMCINACAGIQDPAKAIQAARDELAHLIRLVEPALENGVRIPGLATMNGAKRVLELFTPKQPVNHCIAFILTKQSTD